MKILSVINSALEFIEEQELINYLSSGESDNSKFERDKKLLVEAYNAAVLTVAEYCPLSFTETLTAKDGKIEFSAFTYNPYKIREVISTGNSKIFPTKIECEGKITVTYYYLPHAKSVDDEFDYDNTPITSTVVAYGILSEFLLYKGRFEEAVTYGDKFINALALASKYKKLNKLKAKEWF